jgi:hypothetical protein
VFVMGGERLYGKVDQVPGRCYVATLFIHFFFLPLAPERSFLVFEDSLRSEIHFPHIFNHTFRGIPLRFNIKSWLFAWARTLLVAIAVLTFVGPLSLVVGRIQGQFACPWDQLGLIAVDCLTVGGACIALVRLSYRLSRAPPARAQRLLRLARSREQN